MGTRSCQTALPVEQRSWPGESSSGDRGAESRMLHVLQPSRVALLLPLLCKDPIMYSNRVASAGDEPRENGGDYSNPKAAFSKRDMCTRRWTGDDIQYARKLISDAIRCISHQILLAPCCCRVFEGYTEGSMLPCWEWARGGLSTLAFTTRSRRGCSEGGRVAPSSSVGRSLRW